MRSANAPTRSRPSPTRPRPSPAREPIPRVAFVSQAGREGVVATVLGVGAVAVVGMWWWNTPAGSLHGLAAELTAAGRITGLLGAYLVLVEVLLMSRIPWLDRLIGMDRLAVWHRRNGEYSVTLLAAHAVLITLGYAGLDHISVPGEIASILGSASLLAATAGLGALVVVGMLSARAVRRRIGYQTWYLLHLSTYLALAASFPHEIGWGHDFAGHPANQALWIAFSVAVFGLVATYRVGIPLRNALRHQLRVVSVVAEAPGVVSIYVTGRRLGELRAEAGQFFYWRFWTRDGRGQGRPRISPWQAHPFSLSAAPNPQWLRITVKALGDHSSALAHLTPGTRVFAEGPYGAFTRLRRTRRRVLLIGAGIGIAPLRALLEALPARPGDLTLLYRATRPEDLVFRAELDELTAERGARVHYLVGPRGEGPDPLSPLALSTGVRRLTDHDVFVCGPPGLTTEVIVSLRAAGVPRRRIHTEGFEL